MTETHGACRWQVGSPRHIPVAQHCPYHRATSAVFCRRALPVLRRGRPRTGHSRSSGSGWPSPGAPGSRSCPAARRPGRCSTGTAGSSCLAQLSAAHEPPQQRRACAAHAPSSARPAPRAPRQSAAYRHVPLTQAREPAWPWLFVRSQARQTIMRLGLGLLSK